MFDRRRGSLSVHRLARAAIVSLALWSGAAGVATAQGPGQGLVTIPPPPTPTDVKPGSITLEDVPYPYPVQYLSFTTYGQDVRMAYMDVPPAGTPNGRTVVLFHGMNFAGFYFEGPIDVLRKEGFRVIVPDQIGFGRSSKPIIPYNFQDMALNTRRVLDHLKIAKASIVGHSMGGMLAARFATQHPDITERVVIYNPIGLTDIRYDRPWTSVDDAYKRTLTQTYQTIFAGIARYFSHDAKAWKPEYEKYVRLRYSWTLSGDWPRYAMVQALLGQMPYLDPVVYDWGHIKAPTLALGGREDGQGFPERMKFLADSIPNGNGRLFLIPGVGHVPHFEAPEELYPPLLAFLKEGLTATTSGSR
jgi:pimeloyl-ACP methyl ester carboxylesterase